jgi:hypothetical protein
LSKGQKEDLDETLKHSKLTHEFLELNENKRANFFTDTILNGKESAITDPRITKNIENSKHIISDFLKLKKKSSVEKIYNFIKDNIEVVIVPIKANEMLHTELFASVNSNKLELENYDLIKTHIISLCYRYKSYSTESISKVSGLWNKLYELFNTPDHFEDFLIDYWACEKKFITKKGHNLYNAFSDNKTGHPSKIIEELMNYAKHYIKIFYQKEYKSGVVQDWNPRSDLEKKLQNSFLYMKSRQIKVGYPLILYCMVKKKGTLKDLVKLSEFIESYTFLNLGIMGIYPEETKKSLLPYLNLLQKGTSIKIVNEKLKDDIKSRKAEFIRASRFSNLRDKDTAYMLHRIVRANFSHSLCPKYEELYKKKYREDHIEHILPQGFETEPEWRKKILEKIAMDPEFMRRWNGLPVDEQLEKFRNEFLNLIGNKSFLVQSDNSSIGRCYIDKKIKKYKLCEPHNPLYDWIISKVELSGKWDNEEIQERSEVLMEKYLKIFI